MSHAEESGTGIVVRGMDHRPRQVNRRRDRRIQRTKYFRNGRTQRRPPADRSRAHAGIAGKTHVASMIIDRSDDRTDEHEFVHASGDLRQVFADIDAGHGGGNRCEFAADFSRGRRLGIKRIDVRRPARQEDHDHRFVGVAADPLLFGPQQLRQRQAGPGGAADFEKLRRGRRSQSEYFRPVSVSMTRSPDAARWMRFRLVYRSERKSRLSQSKASDGIRPKFRPRMQKPPLLITTGVFGL